MFVQQVVYSNGLDTERDYWVGLSNHKTAGVEYVSEWMVPGTFDADGKTHHWVTRMWMEDVA